MLAINMVTSPRGIFIVRGENVVLLGEIVSARAFTGVWSFQKNGRMCFHIDIPCNKIGTGTSILSSHV